MAAISRMAIIGGEQVLAAVAGGGFGRYNFGRAILCARTVAEAIVEAGLDFTVAAAPLFLETQWPSTPTTGGRCAAATEGEARTFGSWFGFALQLKRRAWPLIAQEIAQG